MNFSHFPRKGTHFLKDGEMWPDKRICTPDCVSVVTVLLLDQTPTPTAFLIAHVDLWQCWVTSTLHYIFMMWSVAPFPMLVFGLGLMVLLVKFLFHFMFEVQRNMSETVDAVRSMLRIGSPWGHPQSICFQTAELFFFLRETKINRYSSSRNYKTTTSQDLCI